MTDTNTTTVWSTSSTTTFPYETEFACEDIDLGPYENGVALGEVDNTAQIQYEQGNGPSDSSLINVRCYRPSVSKDATPSYTLTYTWQLEKVVYPQTVNLFDGANATLNYTVTATRDNGTSGSWGVTGIISVTNPHPTDSIASAAPLPTSSMAASTQA